MRIALALGAALLCGLAGCAAPDMTTVEPKISSTAIMAGKAVRLTDAGPVPQHLVAGPGDMVVWTNDTGAAQRIELIDGTPPSPQIPPGGTYQHRFPQSGSFAYHVGGRVGVVEINLPPMPDQIQSS